MSAEPGAARGKRDIGTITRRPHDSLITHSSTSSAIGSSCLMRSSLGFSVSATMVSVVDSERELLVLLSPGSGTFSGPTSPSWTPYASRIEIRLLRDTRRVLEYLSKKACAVGHVGMTTTRIRRRNGDGTHSFPST